MGGTTSSTVDNINSSISNNIMTSIQKSQTNINVQQNISGTCDTEIIQNLSTKYTDCIIGMADKFPSDKVLSFAREGAARAACAARVRWWADGRRAQRAMGSGRPG